MKIFKVVFVEIPETIFVHDLHQHAESLLLGHLKKKSERYHHDISDANASCINKHNQSMMFRCINCPSTCLWQSTVMLSEFVCVSETESETDRELGIKSHRQRVCPELNGLLQVDGLRH